MSGKRVTFNEVCSDMVCHQKLVRDKAGARADANKLFPQPAPEKLRLKLARVRKVTRSIAWKVISRYEWLGTLPANASDFYGIFFGGIYCAGVACFQVGSCGAGNGVMRFFGLHQTEIAYLARGACVHWAPKGAASKLINFATKLVAEDRGCKVALAYADTDAGEIGTVYQAAGWTCLGRGSTGFQIVSPEGKFHDQRYIGLLADKHNLSWTQVRAKLKVAGWTEQPRNPKLRYTKLLKPGEKDSRLKLLLKSHKVPYPKRARPPSSGASSTP